MIIKIRGENSYNIRITFHRPFNVTTLLMRTRSIENWWTASSFLSFTSILLEWRQLIFAWNMKLIVHMNLELWRRANFHRLFLDEVNTGKCLTSSELIDEYGEFFWHIYSVDMSFRFDERKRQLIRSLSPWRSLLKSAYQHLEL